MADCEHSPARSRVRRIAASCVTLSILCGLAVQSARADDASERQAVEKAAAQFYAALNALFTGDVKPMEQVWSHADDVTYMGPGGGFQHGWPQVLANWKAQAAKKLGGRVEPAEMQTTVGRELAIVHAYEKGQNTVDGKPQKVSIRATNVFRKENGQWKMIGHHTDRF